MTVHAPRTTPAPAPAGAVPGRRPSALNPGRGRTAAPLPHE